MTQCYLPTDTGEVVNTLCLNPRPVLDFASPHIKIIVKTRKPS